MWKIENLKNEKSRHGEMWRMSWRFMWKHDINEAMVHIRFIGIWKSAQAAAADDDYKHSITGKACGYRWGQ